MLRVFLFLMILTITVAGCAHLNPDPVEISAQEANYPTALISACGKFWNGLAICHIQPGEDYSKILATIHPPFSGSVRITSESCNLNVSQEYSNSTPIPVPVSGIAQKNCVIAVSVSPTYPTQKRNNIVVYPMTGYIYVQVAASPWVGTARKVPVDFRSTWKIKTGDTNIVSTIVRGCGVDFSKKIMPIDGVVQIDLNETTTSISKICASVGKIFSQDFEDVQIGALLAQYDSRMIPLPIPLVSIKKDGMVITANGAVSVLSFDGKHCVTSSASYSKIDWSKTHVVGALTVKGRSVYGVWSPEKGEFTWLQ